MKKKKQKILNSFHKTIHFSNLNMPLTCKKYLLICVIKMINEPQWCRF